MKNRLDDVRQGLLKFQSAAQIAGVEFGIEDIEVDFLPAPHKSPSSLPIGKMAVYAFFVGDACLKCGKVGPKSQARYTSQHYNPKSAPSTLAASLLKSEYNFGTSKVDSTNVGDWIKQNTDRVNLVVPEEKGAAFLGFLESFFHVYWGPIFEGHRS